MAATKESVTKFTKKEAITRYLPKLTNILENSPLARSYPFFFTGTPHTHEWYLMLPNNIVQPEGIPMADGLKLLEELILRDFRENQKAYKIYKMDKHCYLQINLWALDNLNLVKRQVDPIVKSSVNKSLRHLEVQLAPKKSKQQVPKASAHDRSKPVQRSEHDRRSEHDQKANHDHKGMAEVVKQQPAAAAGAAPKQPQPLVFIGPSAVPTSQTVQQNPVVVPDSNVVVSKP